MSVILLWCLGSMHTQAGRGPDGVAPKGRKLADVLRDFPRLLSNETLILLCASSVFRSMTQGGLMAFLPLYLARELDYPPIWIGAVMAALQIAGFIAAPISGNLSDRVGRRQIMLSSMLVTAVIIVGMIFVGQSTAFVFLIAFLGFFFFSIRAVLQAWLLDATPPHMGGSSIGTLFAIQALGSSIGPLVCGLIADRYGLPATFYFLVVTIIVANTFVFFTPIPERSPR
jgi:predicted MFS family arabinose efflux permease